jgi:hypothetical protein
VALSFGQALSADGKSAGDADRCDVVIDDHQTVLFSHRASSAASGRSISRTAASLLDHAAHKLIQPLGLAALHWDGALWSPRFTLLDRIPGLMSRAFLNCPQSAPQR